MTGDPQLGNESDMKSAQADMVSYIYIYNSFYDMKSNMLNKIDIIKPLDSWVD